MWKGGMHVMSPNTEVAPGTPPTVSSVCHRLLRCVTAVYAVPDTSQEIIICPKHENVWSDFAVGMPAYFFGYRFAAPPQCSTATLRHIARDRELTCR